MLNKCQFIGRLGADPEVYTFENGDKSAKFSIACSEQWKTKNGEKKEKTEWINIVVYRKLAEIVESYFTKGMLVYIEGKMQTRSYDLDNGNKRYVTEIICDYGSTVKMLEKKDETSGQKSSTPLPPPPENSGETGDGTDDLPF